MNFPLMLLPLVAYNLLVFLFGGVSWNAPVASVYMLSGADWTMTPSDIMVLFALALLFFEILKATRTHSASLFDHLLSTVVFIVFLVEFLLVAQAATSTFFLLTAIALLDVVAGYSVTIMAARRDFSVGPPGDV